MLCLDDDQGIYQQAAHNLQQYINASQRPGKKQTDFSDLFVYQEYAHDYEMDEVSTLEEIQEEILRRANDPKYLRLDEKGCSKLLTIIDPEYPDIILFEKWLYMDSLDNISEANKIYYEIKAIADELSKDYADNQVTQMLSMGIVRKL